MALLNPSRRSDFHYYRHSDAEALGLYDEIVVSDANMSEIGMHMQKRLAILQVCLCRVRPDHMLVRLSITEYPRAWLARGNCKVKSISGLEGITCGEGPASLWPSPRTGDALLRSISTGMYIAVAGT
jgi:hypothetical protein